MLPNKVAIRAHSVDISISANKVLKMKRINLVCIPRLSAVRYVIIDSFSEGGSRYAMCREPGLAASVER